MIKQPKQIFWILFIAQMLLSAGCEPPFSNHKSSEGTTQPQNEKKIAEVYVESFAPKEVFTPVKLAGFIRLRDQAPLYSPVSGVVTRQHRNEGDLVTKEQVILSIKPDHQGIESRPFNLKAPLSGTLVRWTKKNHEHINANEELGLIANLNAFEIETFVTSGDFEELKSRQHLSAFISSQNSGEQIKLNVRVKKMTPVADHKTLAYPVTFDILCKPNDPCFSMLKSGLIAQVLIKKNIRNTYLIPSKFLHKRSSQIIVADHEGKARFHDIKTGEIFGDESEILEGLNEGMRVITMYSMMPSEGDTLTIEKDPSSEPSLPKAQISSQEASPGKTDVKNQDS